MPTYNQELYIGEAIESVLSQNYQNYEIVIGDDASQDKTWEIIKQFEGQHPNKIKAYRNKKNLGITKNCNRLLKQCRGEYIAFTAGDDLFLPGKLEKQVSFMLKEPECSVSYHNVEVFYCDSKTPSYGFNNSRHAKPRQGSINLLIEFGMFFCGCSIMLRSSQLPKNGYREDITIASDWLFFAEALAEKGTINYIPEVLGRYRRHASNITSQPPKFEEARLSHQLLADNHPHLSPLIERYEWRLDYSEGVYTLLHGNKTLARNLLFHSLKKKPMNPKAIYWILRSFV